MAVQRTFYRDRYNHDKVWEVTKLHGGYYLRQYVCGEQFGKGLRTTKKFIQSLGILDFEVIEGIKRCRGKNPYLQFSLVKTAQKIRVISLPIH